MIVETRLLSTAFLLTSMIFGQLTSFAQNRKPGVSYDQPKRLVLNGIGEPKLGDNGYPIYLTEAFYPIGFSKSGNFAYYVEPADEACGCYFARLVIQDLRTDKILWQHDHEGVATDAVEGKFTPNETIAEHWKKNQTLFSRKLAQYGIRAESQFSLESSAGHKNDVLTPKLELDIKKRDVYSVDGKVRLWMMSKQRGKKIIYRKSYKVDDYSGFRTAEVSGLLKSPFEPRVAVVVVEEKRGYEGPPNTTNIRIVGSDLMTRFR